ncbi:hypothetical protein DSL72_007214 [Monilinia vaccinii-corymbosi]|uniref:Uncharacterized protein n=1 Tax=Monilinia vaccinii-corymbosi TaxID=61207 RepID=A0A8A3PLT0_9HELO|nr:hypothetical protein DSL72_007214 [Monilinia vaccinii-corymbosi]
MELYKQKQVKHLPKARASADRDARIRLNEEFSSEETSGRSIPLQINGVFDDDAGHLPGEFIEKLKAKWHTKSNFQSRNTLWQRNFSIR